MEELPDREEEDVSENYFAVVVVDPSVDDDAKVPAVAALLVLGARRETPAVNWPHKERRPAPRAMLLNSGHVGDGLVRNR